MHLARYCPSATTDESVSGARILTCLTFTR